nr:PTS sugar transporter subunit IIA [Clavibacter zhangzhiyongii]
MLPPLPDDAVTLGAEAADWRAAVRLAGDALVRTGAATADYAEAMIRVVEEFGAYVVIAPGLALAHARPGPETLADGLAVVTLREPVAFGHAHNDPGRRHRRPRGHHGRPARLVGRRPGERLQRRHRHPAAARRHHRRRGPAHHGRRGERMKVVAICGVGIGTSGILKVNAERALARLGIDADVTAADLASVASLGEDAQVILTSPELVDRIGATYADVVVIENYFDLEEISAKLDAALG